MDNITVLLNREFFSNTTASYLYSAIFFCLALAALYAVRDLTIARLKAMAARTATDLDDLIVDQLSGIKTPEYVIISIYAATRNLKMAAFTAKGLLLVLLLAIAFRAVVIVQRLISYWLDRLAATRNLSDAARKSVVQSTRVILNTLVWIAAGLFILDNLGVNVSAILTGLGIGGVAVALAAQAILGDLFNFFVILLDKPFNVGDFVTSEAVSGTIEHIGLKSTRIRSLSGELVIISNSKLLESRIRNFADLQKRRVAFNTRVALRTPPEKLRRVPALIKEAVAARPGLEFERSNLAAAGEFSMDFETVYHLPDPDYALFMASQEAVLLGVLERLAKEGVELAAPLQAVALQK